MVVINKLYPEVIKTCRPLILEDEVLKEVVKKYFETLGKSLSAQHALNSTVKCNLTHVNDFPDGREKGSFIALEFSGRIFRLAYIGLKGDRSHVSLSRLYEFPYLKLNENFSKVVDYIAKCVGNFIHSYDITDKRLILGVTSSFPMSQDCLQEGKITQWGRDFKSFDLENQDFFNQLKFSLRKYPSTRGIYLISLVNNSTACLMAGLYKDPCTRIGLFVGDDTNVTYLEKFENMTVYTGDGLRTRAAVGVEMKNFGNDGALDFVRTEFDKNIDDASANPRSAVLDKMASAAQLGEITRLYLYKLTTAGVILGGYASPLLSTRNSLRTSDLAMMEMDDEDKFIRCKAVMRSLGYKNVSNEDCIQIRFVGRCVAKRSSYLIAACIAAMINRMDSKYIHIMADGYLIKEFPKYEAYLSKKIQHLKKPEYKFSLITGEKNEVAVGAGIVAFIYKDAIIKLEDKRRALPPFNINKYNITSLPASLIDCECESEIEIKKSIEKPEKPKKIESKEVETTILLHSKKTLEIRDSDINTPLCASTLSFNN